MSKFDPKRLRRAAVYILLAVLLAPAVLWVISRLTLEWTDPTNPAIDQNGRSAQDPSRIEGGVSMTLAQVRLAPLPRDGAALEFSVKRTLLGTGVIFRAAFKTSPAALQQWLASSPPLASLAHRGVSTHREARTIPPPQGSPPSTTAEVSIDYDLSAVTVIIRW